MGLFRTLDCSLLNCKNTHLYHPMHAVCSKVKLLVIIVILASVWARSVPSYTVGFMAVGPVSLHRVFVFLARCVRL